MRIMISGLLLFFILSLLLPPSPSPSFLGCLRLPRSIELSISPWDAIPSSLSRSNPLTDNCITSIDGSFVVRYRRYINEVHRTRSNGEDTYDLKPGVEPRNSGSNCQRKYHKGKREEGRTILLC